ncbi:MAG TPA: CDP-alcohol phosphatidyltransferase family protein [Phenylobacterium sp.]|nr:CDP-alcohol phosphatidyltransferase family protein [Phenylobacterium sp.]
MASDAAADRPAPVGVVIGASDTRLWGMTAGERLERSFRRAGVEPGPPSRAARGGLIARGDYVMDEALIKALAGKPGVLLTAEDGTPVAAHVVGAASAAMAALEAGDADAPGLSDLQRTDVAGLGSAYNAALRKREPPLLAPLTPQSVNAIEKRLFAASYKGVTDLVTKYAWPVPARIVTRWCAERKITPNQVTFAGFLLVLLAFWAFWNGDFALGLVAGWLMTFLDTVDGKLARVTLTSSKWGNIFDHGIDLIHPPFWWWAWWVGVQAGPHPLAPDIAPWVLASVTLLYALQRAEEGIFMRLYGMHIHSWRPFDSWFRLITARRNPNLILLTLSLFIGRPDLGLLAVAAWTILSFLVHLVRLFQALATPRAKVVSWLSA